MGPTDPNRYHMWTGWVGNDGKGGGPVIDNAEAGYDWSTYPERLQKVGISWKIYQDAGAGLDAAHFWGLGGATPMSATTETTPSSTFINTRAPQPGSALYERAITGTDVSQGGSLFDAFLRDVAAGELPQVS